MAKEGVLVTGGAGYIGSVVVNELVEQGERVVVVDDFSAGHREAIIDKEVKVEEASVLDKKRMVQIMEQNQIGAVMHFAAFADVALSMKHPLEFFRNNTAGTLALVSAMEQTGVDTLVFSSTAAVYGMPKTVPVKEEDEPSPVNPYGESKLMVEQMLAWQSKLGGLKYSALRYFNVCGATEHLGENHKPETHLIPLALDAAMGRRPALKLFGTDYDTPDGTCVRDYIHVRDLAKAHLMTLDRLRQAEKHSSVTYNLGNQTGFSNRQIIEAVGSVTGRQVPVVEEGRRPGDPAVLVASSDKIKKELGWEPQFVTPEAIILTAYLWMNSHPNGYEK